MCCVLFAGSDPRDRGVEGAGRWIGEVSYSFKK